MYPMQMWYIYIMEYYTAIKNEIMPPAGAWMDLEIHTKWSKPDGDKYHITCGI